MKLIIFLLSGLLSLTVADRVVMTSNGPLQGVTVFSGQLEVEAYLGIPYAEPPVGSLRFMKPVPKGPWKGVYKAFHQPPTCMQHLRNRYYEPSGENMTEDCLFLSLWVPYSRRETKLKPIILFIHGGGFIVGSGNMPLYEGTNLAKFGDVIVANLNYRVGSLGFFFADVEDADGNQGIFDQILAMKWISQNAKAFGGDPNHIVLMGHSAGSMMAGGHLVSPITKNYVKRVIMHSGAPTLPVILDKNERLLKNSQTFAQLVGCANKTYTLKDNPSAIVQCIKRLSPQKLTEGEGEMSKGNPVPFFPRTGDTYMPEGVIHRLKKGDFLDAEMLIGVDEIEGTFFLTEAAPDYFGEMGRGRVHTVSKRLAYQLVRVIFGYFDKKHSKDIAAHYINHIQNGTTEDFIEAIARAVGDFCMNCDSYFHAEYHSIRNPVYFYVFTHRPSTTPNAEWMRVTHIDDLQYAFGNSMIGNYTPEEVVMSERMMTRWIEFAKTGNPNAPGLLNWPAFTRKNPEYMDIDLEESIRLRPDKYRCEYWRDKFYATFDNEIVARIRRTVNKSAHNTVNALLVISSVLLAFVHAHFL